MSLFPAERSINLQLSEAKMLACAGLENLSLSGNAQLGSVMAESSSLAHNTSSDEGHGRGRSSADMGTLHMKSEPSKMSQGKTPASLARPEGPTPLTRTILSRRGELAGLPLAGHGPAHRRRPKPSSSSCAWLVKTMCLCSNVRRSRYTLRSFATKPGLPDMTPWWSSVQPHLSRTASRCGNCVSWSARTQLKSAVRQAR
mmetsp:Transcript_60740/g.163770  ORF Transcript_60740/g.163770 Transcript_60740/m.163770 type:complete len:200 (+) Transcript_60740:576-1175(+)